MSVAPLAMCAVSSGRSSTGHRRRLRGLRFLLGHHRRQRRLEPGLGFGQRHAILGALWSRQTRLDHAEIELDGFVILRVGAGLAEQPLRLGIGLDELHLRGARDR
jgi:hypothetical protein